MAHGKNKHGEEPAAAEAGQVEVDGTVTPTASSHASPADDAAVSHDQAGGGLIENLHPATVHFPIALLLMAAVLEAFFAFRPASDLARPVRLLVIGGAAGAVVAALFGWLHTGMWMGGEATMQWHRWTGTGISIAGLTAAILAARDTSSRAPLRIVLAILAAALVWQGYLGGELAHGPNHLGL